MQLFVATLNFTVVRKIINLAVPFLLKNTFGNRPKKFDYICLLDWKLHTWSAHAQEKGSQC